MTYDVTVVQPRQFRGSYLHTEVDEGALERGNGRATVRSVLRHLDLRAVSDAAKKESRNREIRLPPISVYRWWARRTEAVNGAILDAFSTDFPGRKVIVDPFSGGGVIPLAAVLRNHVVYAQDLDPWAAAGMRAMFSLPPAQSIKHAQERLRERHHELLSSAYGTHLKDGSPAEIAHTFRVAVTACGDCGTRARMFPHAVVTLLQRKERGSPAGFVACPDGHLHVSDTRQETACQTCGVRVSPEASYTKRRRLICRSCGYVEKLEDRARNGGWGWEVVLVERVRGSIREISIPTAAETEQAESAQWSPRSQLGMIPDGQETRVLLRHGFQSWNQLYPRRQLAVTEAILSGIDEVANDFPTRSSLQMAVYGASEMAGHLSRWDRWYLKSYEAMANHRFNLTTFAVEPNIWGVPAAGRGTIQRRLSQMAKAAEWLASRKESPIRVEGPLDSGGAADSTFPQHIDVRIVQGSSERMLLPDATAHLVLTDPPYHDDVQYGELSSLFRAWAQLPAGCLAGEAVVNEATGQNAEVGAYQDLLTKIFSEAQRVLRSDGHLVLSYANREPLAWIELLNGFQRAGFRAVGYTIVHSENETDHAKRGVRACNLDLIMDLVPQGGAPTEKWHAQEVGNSPEAEFLGIVGSAFLDVGALHPGWETSIISRLGSSRFLKGS